MRDESEKAPIVFVALESRVHRLRLFVLAIGVALALVQGLLAFEFAWFIQALYRGRISSTVTGLIVCAGAGAAILEARVLNTLFFRMRLPKWRDEILRDTGASAATFEDAVSLFR